MESHSGVTESTQQEDHSETENNEKKQKSTPYSQKLPFDEDLEFSNLNSIQLEKVYNELCKAGKPQFHERFPFPDIKVLARLARRVYKEGTNDQKLANIKMPDGWQLLTTAFNNASFNHYFGAAYWNPKEQQIVVAHRGTTFENEGPLWTDVKGIVNNKTVPQMKSAITFAHKIKVIVEELNKRDDVFLQLSFTGHSLGGWLAQITTLTAKHFSTKEIDKKLLFVKSKTVGYHAHTVAFDSPGCKEMLLKIKRRYDLSYNKDSNSLEIDDLDITIYLSAPNFFNTFNSHVGTLYRVFTGDASRSGILQYTKKVHKIKRIENVFTSDNKDKTLEVIDWPSVNKGITERLVDIFVNKRVNEVHRTVRSLFKGKGGKELPLSSDYNEYEYFHRVAKIMNDYNPNPDDKDGYCEIRYQVKEVDKTQHSTNAFTLAELDFLSQYKILRDNPVKKLKDVLNQFGDEAQKIEDALKDFEIDKSKKVICCNSEQELEKLIRYVKYIIRFSPGITSKIKNTIRDDPVWFRVDKLNESFIGRTKELEELLHTYILADKGRVMPVITGLDGVGKSELTIKYVHEYYGKDNSIIWINAENEEARKQSFKVLHEQLSLKNRAIDEEVKVETIVNDVYKYLFGNNGSSIFIFDNAENYAAVEKFLPQGLTDCDKIHVVITSTNSVTADWETVRTKTKAVKLEEFNDEEAKTFVKNSLEIKDDLQDKDIESLIQTLHKFPLALHQAVAYIKTMKEYSKNWKNEYQIHHYLKEYEQDQKKMLSTRTGPGKADSNREVYSTLNMTINKINANEKFGEKALDMLDIISYFAPNNIPGELFVNRVTNLSELILITQPLIKYSIVRLENGMLNVHGLVQQIIILKIKEKSRLKSEEEILKKTLQLLTEHVAVCEYNEPEADAEKMEREKKEIKEKESREKDREEREHEKRENEEKESEEKKHEEKDREKKEREKKERKEKDRKKREHDKRERQKIELCTPHVVSVWNHAYKYFSLIEEFLIRGKKIKISRTGPGLSVTYFNFIVAGCKYDIVKNIIDQIEEKYPKDRNKIKNFINTRNNDKECALHGAAKNGDEQTVKLLVSKGADVNARKKYGWTPLSLAAFHGRLSIVEFLLGNEKIEIGRHRTGREQTELHFASINGNVEMVKLLLGKGADKDISEKNYNPKVNYSEEKDDVEVSKKAPKVNVSKKGDVNVTQKVPEANVSKKGDDVNVSQKAPKANDSKKDTNADEKIQKRVAYVNAKDQRHFTALHFAVKNNHLEIIKLLLKDKRIDVNAKNEWERTPLHFAVKKGNLESVKMLLNKDADVNAKRQSDNFTPLHMAVLDGNNEIITYLLNKTDIEIDAQTTEGNTALHLAAGKGNLQVVEILIQRNADASIVNKNGKLASDLAGENAEVKNYIEKMSKYSKRPHDQEE